jgi:hypothetical protein
MFLIIGYVKSLKKDVEILSVHQIAARITVRKPDLFSLEIDNEVTEVHVLRSRASFYNLDQKVSPSTLF